MLFFILILTAFLVVSILYIESTLAFLFLLLILFLVLWSRFFSRRVLLSTFARKRALQNTVHFRKQKAFDDELLSFSPSGVNVFIYRDKKDIQFYFIDTKPLTVVCSEFFINVHTEEELKSLLKSAALVFKSHKFKNRQKLVAMFIHIGRIFRQVDTLLCFVFGINTIKGEPRMITRMVVSPILNWFCSILVPGAEKSPELKKLKAVHLLKSQSYLDIKHINPLFGPLSLTDYILYQD